MTSSDFSVDIASLPHDQYPLSENEQNVFNMFFLPEFQERQKLLVSSTPVVSQPENEKKEVIQEQDKKQKRSFFKKLLISLVGVAILLIHALTPVSPLLKMLTSKPAYAVVTIILYTILIYVLLEKI